MNDLSFYGDSLQWSLVVRPLRLHRLPSGAALRLPYKGSEEGNWEGMLRFGPNRAGGSRIESWGFDWLKRRLRVTELRRRSP